MRVFFIVVAKEGAEVKTKTQELEMLGFPYIVVCGEDLNCQNVVYRKPQGKYDAINFALQYVPENAEVVALNDVDTKIHNLSAALNMFNSGNFSLVFSKVDVRFGPQLLFYSILDKLRKSFPIVASGELMLIRNSALRNISPLKACKAEDSYILFKILENRNKVVFCRDCYVTTRRTATAKQEEDYKRRTVGGIYQALSMAKPSIMARLFYMLLPFVAPLLLIMGKKGYYWTKGILLGYSDYLKGDRSATWRRAYE